MELVGLVASGKEAVKAFTQHRPEVTLMDLALPNAEGLTTLRKILKIDAATCGYRNGHGRRRGQHR
jgi:chemotaxis response regulator CheB